MAAEPLPGLVADSAAGTFGGRFVQADVEPLPGLVADSAAAGSAAGSADESTVVYTDGACLGNPGPGGWAWAVPGGDWVCGADPHTTNQRMELQAALDALRELDGPVIVVSDSAYVVNCFRDRWYEGWKRRGWRNANKKPVANRDLWEPLIELYLSRPGAVSFRWVKGHSGDEWNEIVDRLAFAAASDQISRRGR